MLLRRVLPAALLVLALLAAPAAAQGAPVVAPPDAREVAVGDLTLAFWVGTASAVDENVSAEENASLWFAWRNATAANTTTFLNVTVASGAPQPLVLLGGAAANVSLGTLAPGSVSYSFSGEVYRNEAANATENATQNATLVLVGPVSGGGSFTVEGTIDVPAPPTGLPTPLLVGLGLLLLGVLVGGVVAGKKRAERRRMNEAPRRSQVMRELELEKQLEKAKQKDPEQAVVIQQEIRQQEQVREKRRELQILEAKRADALKTLDLLRKRHESGGLTKLQYDNMVAKKQQDLQRIEAEIAQMEAQDGGPAAGA